MDFLKEQFRAPPMPGSVTDLCHKATDDMLGTNADWALFMDIVDRVKTANDEVLLESVRAVRRLLASNKHNTVILTLKLIEALIKNSQRFREGCNNEKFCNCMLKVWEKGTKGGHDNLQVRFQNRASFVSARSHHMCVPILRLFLPRLLACCGSAYTGVGKGARSYPAVG